MSATGRGLPVVTVSHMATGKDNRDYQRREFSLSGGQLIWLASQGRKQALVQGQYWRCREQNQKKPGQGKGDNNYHLVNTYSLPDTVPDLGMFSHLVPASSPRYRKGTAAIRKRQIKSRNLEQHKYQSTQEVKELESVVKQNSGT